MTQMNAVQLVVQLALEAHGASSCSATSIALSSQLVLQQLMRRWEQTWHPLLLLVVAPGDQFVHLVGGVPTWGQLQLVVQLVRRPPKW